MILFYSVFLVVALALSVVLFINQAKFGKLPKGEDLERIKQSPHFKNGKFENIEHTPDLSEGASVLKIAVEFFFKKNPNSKPTKVIPFVKTNIHQIDRAEDVLIWFGHSSYLLQVDGKRFLVDPVFEGNASPIPNNINAFAGSNEYSTNDIPGFDYLIITHDHWDHLDYKTVLGLSGKYSRIITSLGVGTHLQHWGIDKSIITELDWNKEVNLGLGFKLIATPARHFSGRGFKRAQSLWSSFVLITPNKKLFLGGDSGYGNHFKEIGNTYGPFDLAILECGQYNANWKYVHMMPEELLLATKDLNANKLLPVHWAKFALAMHDWNEPIKRVVKDANAKNTIILTPIIGEKLNLNAEKVFDAWWEF
jgi:L-ascorbate metabolism protein UlaG (beta-lactamase superfamily)